MIAGRRFSVGSDDFSISRNHESRAWGSEIDRRMAAIAGAKIRENYKKFFGGIVLGLVVGN
jgi:hypothetical protein